jgi:hypothetical protein
VYTAHSSSSRHTLMCLFLTRIFALLESFKWPASDPSRPLFKAKHKSTLQEIFCLFLRHFPLPVFFVPNLSGNFKYPAPGCSFFLLTSMVLFSPPCQLPVVVSSYTVSGDMWFPDQVTNDQMVSKFNFHRLKCQPFLLWRLELRVSDALERVSNTQIPTIQAMYA